MDDWFLVADDEAQATTLLRLFAAVGLRINTSKSHAIGWSPHEPVPDGMQRVALTEAAREAAPSALPGTRVLGVPLGTDAYIHDEVSKIVDDAERDASLTWYLGSRQAAFLLLRTCVAAQVRYLARALPPEQLMPHARRFDGILRKHGLLLAGEPEDAAWASMETFEDGRQLVNPHHLPMTAPWTLPNGAPPAPLGRPQPRRQAQPQQEGEAPPLPEPPPDVEPAQAPPPPPDPRMSMPEW